MTPRPAPPAGAAAAIRSVRAFYLVRVGFSALWVALVLSRASGARPSLLAEVLLVIYPAADGLAAIVTIRSEPTAPRGLSHLNLAVGGVAALAIGGTIGSRLAAAIAIFGAWAVVSGGLMIILALRQRALGGQWLMIISGAGSVLAGTTFVTWDGSPAAGLRALAQYSAGGAVWYLLAAGWLSRSAISRRAGGGSARRPARPGEP
jgi:uncharacterized membrane protein HdeD (DUF308 family)